MLKVTPPAFQPPDCAPVLGELSVYRLRGYAREEYYRGYSNGAIYKLLSPCVRETSNEVAERVEKGER